MKKSWILCLALLSSQSVMAKFNFKLWKGVEKIIEDNNGGKPEEVHPILGKLYFDVIKNLRLGGDLYINGYDQEQHREDRSKDTCKDTEYKDFAILLKELFPSGGGFGPNTGTKNVIGQLTPQDIGSIIRIIRTSNLEILQKNLESVFSLERKANNYNRNLNFFRKINNKKDIKEVFKEIEKNKGIIDQGIMKEINKKETIEAVKSYVDQKIKKMKDDALKIDEQHKLSKKIFDSVQCLKKNEFFPHNLTELAFLTYFWEKFGNKKAGNQDKKDMEDFLKGLTGNEAIKLEDQKIENLNDIYKVLEGQGKDFERSARAIEYGDEVINIFAYPQGFLGDGTNVPYKNENINTSFNNCVEHSLFCLFDLIFYTQDENDKGFKTSEKIKESSLGKFYEGRGERGANTDKEAEWNNVIQNLDLKDIQNTPLDKKIVYNKHEKDSIHYELKPGLIRLMHLFKEISGYQEPAPFTKKNLDEQKLTKSLVDEENKKKVISHCTTWLQGFFEHIAPDGRTFDVHMDDINVNTSHGPDYIGTVKIAMKKGEQKLCEWKWYLGEGHARCEDLKIDPKFFDANYNKKKKSFSNKSSFQIIKDDPEDLFLRVIKNLTLNLNQECEFYEKIINFRYKVFGFNFLESVFEQKKEFFQKYQNKLLYDAIRYNHEKTIEFIKEKNIIDNLNFKNIELNNSFIVEMIKSFNDEKYKTFWEKNEKNLLDQYNWDEWNSEKIIFNIKNNKNITLENIAISNNIGVNIVGNFLNNLKDKHFETFWEKNAEIMIEKYQSKYSSKYYFDKKDDSYNPAIPLSIKEKLLTNPNITNQYLKKAIQEDVERLKVEASQTSDTHVNQTHEEK